MNNRYLLGLLVALPFAVQAQTGTQYVGFEYRPLARVVHGSDTLRHAWAGGMNTPQFSPIELNGDNQPDLYAFDRQTGRSYTFLSVPATTGPGRRWQYAPAYESLFPADLENWALLRDFDCDGRPDLFTYASGGDVRVFRNTANASGQPVFTLASAQLRFDNNVNLNVGYYNMPAIQDMDGDGRLDLLTFDFGGNGQAALYLNTSSALCGGISTFRRVTNFWGQMVSCSDCASFVFPGATSCRGNHTPGHNSLLYDFNADGKLDLFDGRDNCEVAATLINKGRDVVSASFDATSFITPFSGATVPVFPGAYVLDADLDGINDMVLAPNMFDNRSDQVSLRNGVRWFRNGASTGVPSLTLQSQAFLQADMIDVSESAAPAFGDIDGDGLIDLLIGNHADRVAPGLSGYRATLTYYRNVGTATRPVFSLMTNDYLGLSADTYEGLKPFLVDLNRDGALDLAYGAWDRGANVLYYILNTAPAGQPAVFNVNNRNFFKSSTAPGAAVLPYQREDAPCFVDVDNDGFVDLLIGTNETREPGYSLRYFRNRGQGPLDQAFEMMNNDFGQIRTPYISPSFQDRPFNLVATTADFDGDNNLDLLTADGTGEVRLFSNFRQQQGPFRERKDLFYNSLTNQYEGMRALGYGLYIRPGIASADLNGDGSPELVIGTESGGLLSYSVRNRGALSSRAEAARTLALSVYPNPAQTMATVETATPSQLQVLDLTGRVLQRSAQAARHHQLNLSGLAAGVYLVKATGADGSSAVQRLAVE